MENEIILSTVRVGPLDKEIDGFQAVVTFEQFEGSTNQFRRRICVSDFYAGTLVRALLKEREEHVNRIAEMEDQIRSNQERADAEIESLKDELAKVNREKRFGIDLAIPGADKTVTLDIPGQDSGKTLVGVECYFCDLESVGWTGIPHACLGFDGKRYHGPYGMSWNHARPAILGLPS